MPETEIRELIQGLISEYDVLVSIPEDAGLCNDFKSVYSTIKGIMMRRDNPVRVEGLAQNGEYKAFIFGETSKMKKNPKYIDNFVNMVKYAGTVSNIGAMRYN